MKFSTILGSLLFASLSTVHALPESSVHSVESRQDSGCYVYENPDCCIDYGVCECANGWFYELNADQDGCNPPWGFLTTNPNALAGSCC